MNYQEARIYELNARVIAERVRVEGYIAENAERARKGSAPAHSADTFFESASIIENMAQGIREMAECIYRR